MEFLITTGKTCFIIVILHMVSVICVHRNKCSMRDEKTSFLAAYFSSSKYSLASYCSLTLDACDVPSVLNAPLSSG